MPLSYRQAMPDDDEKTYQEDQRSLNELERLEKKILKLIMTRKIFPFPSKISLGKNHTKLLHYFTKFCFSKAFSHILNELD